MLTPDQISALGEAARKITAPVSEYLLQDITRRVAEAGQLTSTAAYQVWRAQQLGVSQRELKKELRRRLGLSHQEIRRVLYQSAQSGYDLDIRRFPYVQALPFAWNASLQQIVAAAVELAQADFTNLVQTLGMVDPFGKALPLQDAYRSCTDFAFQQVITGAASYTEAIRQATRNLAEKGVRTIDYQSGVHTSLEAAVRRNILGGLGLMLEQVSQVTHDQLGCNGWEISAHANSAPDHEPIQGRQYPDREYEALNNSLRRRIGTLNCGHTAFPIILGVNRPQHSKAELEQFRADNEKGVDIDGRHYTGYEATQMQRKLERTIRAQKRRVLVDEAAGDKEKLSQDQSKLTLLHQRYAQFSKAAGLKTQYERTEVAGFGERRNQTAASLLAAPRGHLVQDGEVFNPETAVDSLLKRLENSPGMADNIAVLRYYASHVEFKAFPEMDGSVAYGPNTDTIRYNPGVPLPEGVDRDGIFVHELAHQADRWYYNTVHNPTWAAAIQQAEVAVLENAKIIQSWFDAGGKYEHDAFFSDIVSAVSRGRIGTIYSHDDSYWAITGNREREIFANLSALDILVGLDKFPHEKELEAIYKAFEQIIKGGSSL